VQVSNFRVTRGRTTKHGRPTPWSRNPPECSPDQMHSVVQAPMQHGSDRFFRIPGRMWDSDKQQHMLATTVSPHTRDTVVVLFGTTTQFSTQQIDQPPTSQFGLKIHYCEARFVKDAKPIWVKHTSPYGWELPQASSPMHAPPCCPTHTVPSGLLGLVMSNTRAGWPSAAAAAAASSSARRTNRLRSSRGFVPALVRSWL
jgi:hypothetical protein